VIVKKNTALRFSRRKQHCDCEEEPSIAIVKKKEERSSIAHVLSSWNTWLMNHQTAATARRSQLLLCKRKPPPPIQQRCW
jgi:hypothetical protein